MALISAFLDELAADSELLDSYMEDPEATMTGYGLSPVQQELITGPNLSALRSELERDVGPKPYIVVHKGIVHSGIVHEGIVHSNEPEQEQDQDPPA